MIGRPPRSPLFPYTTLSRSALPFARRPEAAGHLQRELSNLAEQGLCGQDRKSTRLNSSHHRISDGVFCLTKSLSRTACSTPTTWYPLISTVARWSAG